MSANNYRLCPKCRSVELRELDSFRNKVDQSYGKIPLEDFEKMRKEQKEREEKFSNPEEEKMTLREDWEIRMDESGEFRLRYNCQCSQCGFSFEYQHSEQCDLDRDW